MNYIFPGSENEHKRNYIRTSSKSITLNFVREFIRNILEIAKYQVQKLISNNLKNTFLHTSAIFLMSLQTLLYYKHKKYLYYFYPYAKTGACLIP